MGKMDKAKVEDIMQMINVNVNSQAYMTRYVVPLMLKRESRSAIIDISSVCAYGGTGMLPIYAATKGFNLLLSQSVEAAHKDKIDVLTVTPNSTRSNMNSGRYLFSVDAKPHAQQALNQLGWTNNTYGHWVHGLRPYIAMIPVAGYVVDSINASRTKKWLAEEAAKK